MLVRIRVTLVAVSVLGLWIVTAQHWLLGAIVVMVGVGLVDRLTVSVMLARVLHVGWRDLALFRDVAKLAAAAGLAGLLAAGVRLVVAEAGPLAVLAASSAVLGVAYVVSVLALGVPTVGERHAVRARALAMLLRVGLDRRTVGVRSGLEP
jgi:hypothetical protein